MAEALSTGFWLTGQGEIDARLNSATGMWGVLDRVRQVRAHIAAIEQPMVQQRGQWKLDTIVGKLGATPLTEQDITQFRSELDKLDEWSDPQKREALYWADLLPAIQSRHAEVQVGAIPVIAQTLAKDLLDRLEKALAATPSTLNDKVAVEENYQRLSILWEACKREQPKLVGELV